MTIYMLRTATKCTANDSWKHNLFFTFSSTNTPLFKNVCTLLHKRIVVFISVRNVHKLISNADYYKSVLITFGRSNIFFIKPIRLAEELLLCKDFMHNLIWGVIAWNFMVYHVLLDTQTDGNKYNEMYLVILVIKKINMHMTC